MMNMASVERVVTIVGVGSNKTGRKNGKDFKLHVFASQTLGCEDQKNDSEHNAQGNDGDGDDKDKRKGVPRNRNRSLDT